MRTFILMYWAVFSIISYSDEHYSFAQTNPGHSYVSKSVDLMARTAVFVKSPGTGKVGSGVLYGFPVDSSGKGFVFLVTAKHIFERFDGRGRLIASCDTGFVEAQHWTRGRLSFRISLVKKWANLDLALFFVPELRDDLDHYSSKVVPIDMIASISDIRRGMAAYISGYPMGLGTNSKTLNPVVQSGIVAYIDAESKTVLLDIPINPGNSGGPAYMIDDQANFKFLGLAYAYEPSRDFVLRGEDEGFNIVLDTLRTEQDSDSLFVLKKTRPGFVIAPSNSSLARVLLVRDVLHEFAGHLPTPH